MYEYDMIIAGDVTLVKDGDTWTCDGEPVAYPWDVGTRLFRGASNPRGWCGRSI